MADINLTALGMSGSGKTCFLLGMYHEMSSGINGYTLSLDDSEEDFELRTKWQRLNDIKGEERFPTGTSDTRDYCLQLEYAHQSIKSFQWVDYRGGALESRGRDNEEEYAELSERIQKSHCLLIFVGGELLCEKDNAKMIWNIRDKCSGYINQFITGYFKKNRKLPPIALVITKYDKCRHYVSKDQIFEVMKKSFSSLFQDENKNQMAIIPVSIGGNLEDEDYVGDLEPINICQPLFFGILGPLKKEMQNWKNRRKEIYEEYTILENALKGYSEGLTSIFRKKRRRFLEGQLGQLKKEMNEAEDCLQKYIKYTKKVRTELLGLDVFENGKHYVIIEGENYDE